VCATTAPAAVTRFSHQRPPQSRTEWAQLAQALGVKGVHITERDTQRAAVPRRTGEFVGTWCGRSFRRRGCFECFFHELGQRTLQEWDFIAHIHAPCRHCHCTLKRNHCLFPAVLLTQPSSFTRHHHLRSMLPFAHRAFSLTRCVEGFIREGFEQPSELGWGTHERWRPHDAHEHKGTVLTRMLMFSPSLL
jgi:homospermidine synthase